MRRRDAKEREENTHIPYIYNNEINTLTRLPITKKKLLLLGKNLYKKNPISTNTL